MVRREKANYTIQSVSHALDVLEQFVGECDELGVTELSKRLKLHKNNVFRLLATLEARGYIEQNKATENYRLGVRCLRLGQRFLLQTDLLRQARPVMEGLAKEAGETVFVSILNQNAAVVLDAVEPDRPVRLVTRVGDAMPLHATAAGKALLAFSETEATWIEAAPELARFTAATTTDSSRLRQQLAAAQQNGFTTDSGEFAAEVSSLAVPIRDYTRSVVAALSIAGPSPRIGELSPQNELVAALIRAGQAVSARLGFHADTAI